MSKIEPLKPFEIDPRFINPTGNIEQIIVQVKDLTDRVNKIIEILNKAIERNSEKVLSDPTK